MADLKKEEFRLENIFGPVKEFAQKHGDFPVIVAGGIYYHEDIVRWVNEIGADGVQMGTRFAATHESGASADFKQAIIDCREEDIIVAKKPGSPCGLPFRIIKTSPGYQTALEKTGRRNATGDWCCAKTKKATLPSARPKIPMIVFASAMCS